MASHFMPKKKQQRFDEFYTEKYQILAEKVLGDVVRTQSDIGKTALDGILINEIKPSQLDYLPLFRKKLEESLETAGEIFTQIGLMPPTMHTLRSLPHANWQGFVEVHDYLEVKKLKPVILFIPQAAVEISEWEEMFRSVVPLSTISRFTLGVDTATMNPTSGSVSMYRKSGMFIDGEDDTHQWQCIVMPTDRLITVANRDVHPMLLPTIPEYLTTQLYGFASTPKEWLLLGSTLLRGEKDADSVLFGHGAAFSISINQVPKVTASQTSMHTYQVWPLKHIQV